MGSLLFGLVCDKFNRLKVCQLIILSMAVASSLVTLATRYEWICVYAIAFGVLDGGYEMLVPVITHDIVGPRKVALAIGTLYCVMSFPKTLGPPIAGFLFDAFNDYNVSFYLNGAVTILSTAIMFLLNWVPPGAKDSEDEHQIAIQSSDSDDIPLNRDGRGGLRDSLKVVPTNRHNSKIWSPFYSVESNGECVYLEQLTVV